MVVLLDLDDDDAFDPFARPKGIPGLQTPSTYEQHPIASKGDEGQPQKEDTAEAERPNPNLNAFSQALGSYPIVTLLTSNLDLNTLHALSLTCRQFRHNLLQYRTRLIQQTLHCSNDFPPLQNPPSLPPLSSIAKPSMKRRLGTCARDLVSSCRRCALTICRNCSSKPPSAARLRLRHRRLCMPCLAKPLPSLTRHWRDPCSCPSSVYLCIECGTGLNVADTNYRRIWTWRTRYSTYLGGLGTGIGEGHEGVKCWRGEKCVASQEVEVEYCREEEGRLGSGSSGEEEGSDRERYTRGAGGEGMGKEERAGYWQQEIEGIGGVVKKKVKQRIRVGKTVKEWEDERDGKEDVLGRESRGEARSWCGWCGRVVWGEKDQERYGEIEA